MKKNDLFCIDWLLQLWMLQGEGRGKLLLVIRYSCGNPWLEYIVHPRVTTRITNNE